MHLNKRSFALGFVTSIVLSALITKFAFSNELIDEAMSIYKN